MGSGTETHEGSRCSVSIIPLGKICRCYPEPPKGLTKHMLTPSRPPKRTADRAEDTAKPKELQDSERGASHFVHDIVIEGTGA